MTGFGERAVSRRREVLAAAVAEAAEIGYSQIRRDTVGKRARRAPACVNQAFGTINALKDEVMRHAVATEHLGILAQGLADGNPIAKAAPDSLKNRALSALL